MVPPGAQPSSSSAARSRGDRRAAAVAAGTTTVTPAFGAGCCRVRGPVSGPAAGPSTAAVGSVSPGAPWVVLLCSSSSNRGRVRGMTPAASYRARDRGGTSRAPPSPPAVPAVPMPRAETPPLLPGGVGTSEGWGSGWQRDRSRTRCSRCSTAAWPWDGTTSPRPLVLLTSPLLKPARPAAKGPTCCCRAGDGPRRCCLLLGRLPVSLPLLALLPMPEPGRPGSCAAASVAALSGATPWSLTGCCAAAAAAVDACEAAAFFGPIWNHPPMDGFAVAVLPRGLLAAGDDPTTASAAAASAAASGAEVVSSAARVSGGTSTCC